MEYKFKFDLKQPVIARDYNEPPREWRGIVMRRWLEENPPYMEPAGLLERYEISMGPEQNGQKREDWNPKVLHEFFVDELRAIKTE